MPKLLSREENARRFKALVEMMDSPNPALALANHSRDMALREPELSESWKQSARDIEEYAKSEAAFRVRRMENKRERRRAINASL